MTDTNDFNVNKYGKKLKGYAYAAAKVIGAVLLLALLVHISWNMFAPTMFGFEGIKMKQALGIVVFAGVLAFIFGHGFRKNVQNKAV